MPLSKTDQRKAKKFGGDPYPTLADLHYAQARYSPALRFIPDNKDALFTIGDVMKVLECDRAAVYALIENKAIMAIKCIGNKRDTTRIIRVTVDEYRIKNRLKGYEYLPVTSKTMRVVR